MDKAIKDAHKWLDQAYDTLEARIGPVPGRRDPYPTDITALMVRLESVRGCLRFSESPGAWPETVEPIPVPKQVGGAPYFSPSDFPGMEIDWTVEVPKPYAPRAATAENIRRLKLAIAAKRGQ